LLAALRGADGAPPTWQANTIVAAPAWSRLAPPYAIEALPLTGLDALPTRWRRPGLLEAYAAAERAGVWRAELHGLHHLPASAWTARTAPCARRGGAASPRS